MQSSITSLFVVGWLVNSLLLGSAIADPKKVLIMGDSLSAAYNISIDQSWPAIFADQLKKIDPELELVNASISGETTHGGVERLPGLLEQHQPEYLILELGGNDGLRGYQFSQTRDNLAQMIEMAIGEQARVLLVGVRLPPNLGPLYNQRFEAIYSELATKKPVAYLPRFLDGVAASDPEYMQDDGIHPSAKAQPILADKVLDAFRSAFIEQLE